VTPVVRMGWAFLLVVVACGREPELRAGPPALAIGEVARHGTPHDWFEVRNRSDAAVELSDYIFVDVPGDFLRADRFDEIRLAPGQGYVQVVTRADSGFALGDNGGLWLYAFEDRTLVDSVTWRSPD
jgi:hypothetical protein